MANTTMLLLTGGSTKDSNLFNPGDIDNRIIDGIISEDMAPGAWVFNDVATKTWVPLDTDTSDAHKLAGPGQVGVILYRPRIYALTGALRLNTDDYDITYTKLVPICTSGIVGCNITDNGASASAGCQMIASATAENADILAYEVIRAAGDSTAAAIKQTVIATLAANIITADVFAIVALGKCMGKIWGGQNE